MRPSRQSSIAGCLRRQHPRRCLRQQGRSKWAPRALFDGDRARSGTALDPAQFGGCGIHPIATPRVTFRWVVPLVTWIATIGGARFETGNIRQSRGASSRPRKKRRSAASRQTWGGEECRRQADCPFLGTPRLFGGFLAGPGPNVSGARGMLEPAEGGALKRSDGFGGAGNEDRRGSRPTE
jgi:hypothetical protein